MLLKDRKAILFPLYLLILALGSYPFADWFRDRFFFLWPRPVQVLYWDKVFHRMRLGDPMPAGIQVFHYHRREIDLNDPAPLSNKLWKVDKFMYRCFPFDKLHIDIDEQISIFENYFYYFHSGGRNIPIVSVSLLPRRIEQEYLLVSIFNGCVAGLLRGLGLGPLFFVDSVIHYVKESYPWRSVQDLNKVYFIYSVQVQKNPYALQTCISYLGSGILTHIMIGHIPRGGKKAKLFFDQMNRDFDKYYLPEIEKEIQRTGKVDAEKLVNYSEDFEEDTDEPMEICMLGFFGLMDKNGIKPIAKNHAKTLAKEVVKFASNQ